MNQKEKWEKTRANGRSKYIWLHWVFGWGILVVIIIEFNNFLQNHFDFIKSFSLKGFLSRLLAFPITGYFLGRFWWYIKEKEYLRKG